MTLDLNSLRFEVGNLFELTQVLWEDFIEIAHRRDTLLRAGSIYYGHRHHGLSLVARQSCNCFEVVEKLLPQSKKNEREFYSIQQELISKLKQYNSYEIRLYPE